MFVWSKTYEFYTIQMEPSIQTKMNVARKLKNHFPLKTEEKQMC